MWAFQEQTVPYIQDFPLSTITLYCIFQPDNEEEISSVTRIYDDFEWLHHCLTTQNNISGIIVSNGCYTEDVSKKIDMDVNVHERLFNITLKHKLK